MTSHTCLRGSDFPQLDKSTSGIRSCEPKVAIVAAIVAGVSKIYIAGAKIAAPKRLLAPRNPARLTS